jgi:MFS family permease
LSAAFLAWLCAGIEMGLGPLIARPAIRDLLLNVQSELTTQLTPAQEGQVGRWFAWYLCAFLLGAAVGGPIFGTLGDLLGRVRALGWSILTFSIFTGLSWWVQTPEQFLGLRFLASLGIGGVWPAAVALISEAWPEAGRPAVAGVLGTAANIGILLMALAGQWLEISPESWRSALLIGAAPILLGLLVLSFVPESPRWLANRSKPATKQGPLWEVFRPPLSSRTLLGILLGTIPLLGTWASGKWMIPWADAQGVSAARTQAVWASGAVIGSAAGGSLANLFGRQLTYFLVSLGSLAINLAIYRILNPAEQLFLPAVFLLGLVATIFFGWLPLYLPELFPTRVRATGTGVTYNFGRIASAAGVLGAGSLMSYFEGDYARVGAVTAWVYGLGMLVILFAPDTGKHTLED